MHCVRHLCDCVCDFSGHFEASLWHLRGIICHFVSGQWDSLFQREVKLQNRASYDTVDDS